MKNVKIKKVIASLLIACTVIGGSFASNVGVFKPVEAKAHYAMPHDYPGFYMYYGMGYDIHVEVIQDKLNSYDDPMYDCGISDGFFGSMTRRAVTNFQDLNGLEMDGIIGPATWNRIMYGY